mmetsp:Transcript_11640/g.16833  ORF Transcript_11640/g.16833 Transcript_11640/m.16833 type:complete len:204 (-) Transcript_11640:500-1111(-)
MNQIVRFGINNGRSHVTVLRAIEKSFVFAIVDDSFGCVDRFIEECFVLLIIVVRTDDTMKLDHSVVEMKFTPSFDELLAQHMGNHFHAHFRGNELTLCRVIFTEVVNPLRCIAVTERGVSSKVGMDELKRLMTKYFRKNIPETMVVEIFAVKFVVLFRILPLRMVKTARARNNGFDGIVKNFTGMFSLFNPIQLIWDVRNVQV